MPGMGRKENLKKAVCPTYILFLRIIFMGRKYKCFNFDVGIVDYANKT